MGSACLSLTGSLVVRLCGSVSFDVKKKRKKQMASRALWTARAISKTPQEIKGAHNFERNADKQARWEVRRNLPADGVMSNLFKLTVKDEAVVHRYDLDASRSARAAGDPAAAIAAAPSKKMLPVNPTRAWRMYAQSLRRYPNLPPLVRVSSRVYAAAALPDDVLELPKEFHDLGWERCSLRAQGTSQLVALPPAELKSVVNKMLPWALSSYARKEGHFAVVRELDGKMVCTEDGISVAGLRIFRGTTATVLHIRNGDITTAVEDLSAVPTSAFLATMPPNQTLHTEFHVRVKSFERMVLFKDRKIGIYHVEDSSGVAQLQLWNVTPDVLVAGQYYALSGIATKPLPEDKAGSGLLPVVLHGSLPSTKVSGVAVSEIATTVPGGAQGTIGLALRLDTRCTVASEKSLWEEVRHHFGEGPFDEEKQKRITRAMMGTPVILSTNLRHTQVRNVRFDFKSPEDVPLDPQLQKLCNDFDRNQPYAVVNDHTYVPLQALHCCYDPRMRSWQEVTVPACSFMPQRRNEVLMKFRGALTDGLRAFGVLLEETALGTKALKVLEQPTPTKPAVAAAAWQTVGRPSIAESIGAMRGGPAARLRTVAVISVANPRNHADEIEKSVAMMGTLKKIFGTQFGEAVKGEQEAVAYIDQALMKGQSLSDPDTCCIFVSPDRETRATHWLHVECLRRGILAVFVRAIGAGKHKLMAEHLRAQLTGKMESDPLGGSARGVLTGIRALENKNVLVVGVDTCHTHDVTTGCVFGLLLTPKGNRTFVQFWRNHVRGKEVERVSEHFGAVVGSAHSAAPLDEVVVFQDGDVYSHLEAMKARLPPQTNISFLCLHKRTHVRFVHRGAAKKDANVVKGVVIDALAPAATVQEASQVPSFFLQCHDSTMSTARTVQYKVHYSSPGFPLEELQKLSFALSHVRAPASTKLPYPTRCAHRISALVERLVDANPGFRSTMIPEPLSGRQWYL